MAVLFEDEQAEINSVLAQLRHAYAQLMAGAVKDQKQFANGLIAPQIAKLEELVKVLS